MIDTSKATAELFAAIAEAQGEVENASKSSANPHFKSKYADLAEVLNTVRPVFASKGLSLVQSTGYADGQVHVHTVVAHKTGGLISSTASCVPAKSDAQGIGAATTYLRRYSLAAMCGIAQEDDDGNAASHNKRPEAKPEPVSDEAQAKAAEFRSAIADATSVEALTELAAGIGKLPKPLKDALKPVWAARRDELTPKGDA